MLVEVRRPGQPPAAGVERRAIGQIVNREGQRRARLARRQRQEDQTVALAQGFGANRGQGHGTRHVGDAECHPRRDIEPAIRRREHRIRIGARAVVSRRPGEHAGARIEARSRRQAVGGDEHRQSLRIDHTHGEAEGRAFLAVDRAGDAGEIRRRVAAAHAEHETLDGGGAVAVEHLQRHRRRGRRRGAHGPGDIAGAGVDRQPPGAGQHAVQHRVVVLVRGPRRVGEEGAHRRPGRRRGGEGGGMVGIGRRRQAQREIRASVVGRDDRDRAAGGLCAHLQDAARQAAAKVDQVPPVIGAPGGALRQAGGAAGRVEHQHGGQMQRRIADVGQRQVVGDAVVQPVVTGVRHRDPHEAGEVVQAAERRDISRGQMLPAHAGDAGANRQRVVVGQQRAEAQQHGARARVVNGGLDRDGAVHGPCQRVVRRVEHAARVGAVGRQHVLVEGHRQERQRQRQHRLVGRVGGDHRGRVERRDHIDFLGLAQQHPPIRGGDDHAAPAAAGGQRDPAQGRGVHHGQLAQRRCRAGRSHAARVVRDKQQSLQRRARPPEGEAVDVAVESQHRLGALAAGEAHHLAAVRPCNGPQRPVRRHREAVDPQILVTAELGENVFHRIEGRNAFAGADIDRAGNRIDRERHGDAVAVLAQYSPGQRIEPQQRPARRRGPQRARPVERHAGDGLIERDQHRAVHGTGRGHPVQRAAIGAARDQEAALGQLDDGLRADPGLAGGDAAGEIPRRERRQYAGEFAHARDRHGVGDFLLGGGEQHVGGGCDHRRRGNTEIRRRGVRDLGRAADVAARAVVRRLQRAVGRHLAVARVVGGQGQKFILVTSGTGIGQRARGSRQLALPDHEVAAIRGHVQRHMMKAGAARVVRHAVADHIAVRHADPRADQRAHRCLAVHHLGQRVGVLGRLGVEQHAGPRGDARACGDVVLGPRRPTHETAAGVARVVGAQQTAGAVAQHLAGQRVDRLDHPGRRGRVLEQVDPRRDAQHEAPRGREIDVLGKAAPPGTDMDGDVAHLDVAEGKTARVEAGIELGDDPDLVHVGAGARIVGESNGVGQRRRGGQEALGVIGLRPADRGQPRRGSLILEIPAEIQHLERIDIDRRGAVDLEIGGEARAAFLEGDPRHIDAKRLELRRRG